MLLFRLYIPYSRESTPTLSEFGTDLLFQLRDNLLHNSIGLLIAHRLGFVLQDEVDGVTLFASLEVLALIDVEENDRAEELLLASIGHALNGGKLYALVHEEGEVAARGVGIIDR